MAAAAPDLRTETDGASAGPRLVTGVGTGEVRLGDTLAKVRAAYGAPTCQPAPSCATPQGFALATFPGGAGAGLSAYFGSEGATLDDTAVLLALWTQSPAVAADVRVGSDRAALDALGPPDVTAGPILAYARGLSVTLGQDGKVAAVAVLAPFKAQRAVPEMEPAAAPPSTTPVALSWPRYKLDGEEIDVVDLHLHPGSFGMLGPGTAKAITAAAPPFLLPILPAFVNTVSSPYTPGVGMVAQARRWGFSRLVYLAVWAPATVGWYTNSDLAPLLYDDHNGKMADGRPLAYGMASILWQDLDRADLLQARCAALESFLQKQDRLIGIKLAHTHQRVPFATPQTACVYDLARKYKKVVALHTGKTPTEGALDEPQAYDPRYLEDTVKRYADVTFLLLHVGQGDRRATISALDLASRYENVALELSALGRPMVINERGEMVMTMEPQFPYVLGEIKRRNLVPRTVWASDGPQTPGFPAEYRDKLVAEMKQQGYTKDQMKAVLAGNFYRLFRL